MTISEARSFLRPLAAANASPNDAFAHQGIVDVYVSSDPAKQREIRGGMLVLLFEGKDWERRMAAQFFATSGAAVEVLPRVVEQCARAPSDALAILLRDAWAVANPETVKILRALFLQDPAKHARVAKSGLNAQPDGETWQCVVQLVKDSEDTQRLYDAFALSFVANKSDEFVELMRGKPETAILAVAERVSSDWETKLLALLP